MPGHPRSYTPWGGLGEGGGKQHEIVQDWSWKIPKKKKREVFHSTEHLPSFTSAPQFQSLMPPSTTTTTKTIVCTTSFSTKNSPKDTISVNFHSELFRHIGTKSAKLTLVIMALCNLVTLANILNILISGNFVNK